MFSHCLLLIAYDCSPGIVARTLSIFISKKLHWRTSGGSNEKQNFLGIGFYRNASKASKLEQCHSVTLLVSNQIAVDSIACNNKPIE